MEKSTSPAPEQLEKYKRRMLAKVRRDEEIGVTGLVRYGGVVDEEWHHMLRGIRGVRAYREMRDNDSTIGASLYAITSLVRQTEWHVQRANDSAGAEEAAVFLEECLVDMSHTMPDFWTEALSMLWFGWSYFEKVFKRRDGRNPGNPSRNSRFDDGRIGWRKISIRAQETLDEWQFDEEGGIRGMYQIAAPKFNRVFIPIQKSILFRVERDKNNPEGRSLLRNAWRDWFFLKRMQELEAIGTERDLVGLPVVHLPAAYMDPSAPPEKAQARADFATLLQQIRRNEHEGVVFPSEVDEEGNPTGFKLSLLSTGGNRQIDIQATIMMLKKSISMTMLTQFLFLGMDKVGSFSLSSDMTDIFAVSLGSILDNLEETFDRFAVRELMQLNGFPEEDWPRLEHGDIERPKISDMANALKTLADGGILTPDTPLEDHVREQMQLPPRDETEAAPEDFDAMTRTSVSVAEVSNGETPTEEDVEDTIGDGETGANGSSGVQLPNVN